MDQRQRSPIKDWVQRLSPTKLKNKPLPPSPQQPSQSTRQENSRPLRSTSANTSPTKPNTTKSKFRNLIRSKAPTAPSPPRSPSGPGANRSTFSLHRVKKTPSSPVGKQYRPQHRNVDLRRLSQKVSDLELQLKEARKELHSVSGHVSRSNSVEREKDADAARYRQARSVSAGGMYGGLTENLLHQSDVDRYAAVRASSWNVAGTSDDAFHGSHIEEHVDRSQIPVEELSPESHKRKRSELRQSSWLQIQDELKEQQALLQNAFEQQQQHQQTHHPKRPRKSSYNRDKELPNLGSEDPAPTESNHTTAQPTPEDLPHPSSRPKPQESIQLLDKALPHHELVDVAPLKPHTEPPSDANNETALPQLPESIPTDTTSMPPKISRHHRRQSMVMTRSDAEEIVQEQARKSREEKMREPRGTNKKLPPSPTRKECPSPSRLERVDEEFEWDDDIF